MDRRVLAVSMAGVIVLAALVAALALRPPGEPVPGGTGLSTFRSYSHMAGYLDGIGRVYEGGQRLDLGGASPGGFAAEGSFSGTNNQVAGVDELDMVKTDGTHIYIASWTNVTIVRAVPASDMAVVARIPAGELDPDSDEDAWTGISGLFLEGDRLVVVGVRYEMRVYWFEGYGFADIWYPGDTRTVVGVFDVSDPAAPVRLLSYGVSGWQLAARLTNGHAYVVVQQYVLKDGPTYVLPNVCASGTCTRLDARAVRYDPASEDASYFTTVLAVDVQRGDYETLTALTGFAWTLYMSPGALYLSLPDWEYREDGTAASWTNVHRVRADGVRMEVTGSGRVPGTLWSQFAMDEHEGYLRLATQSWGDSRVSTGIYVLDGNLELAGSLEGIAPGETMFAVRFAGDTGYLVTFRRIDPFFVIDLSLPADPKIVGELEIPGFSTYLHPFDGTHVLGIGQEGGAVKVSLYDVSDPANPVESSKWLSGEWSWSWAMWDHHALLVDVDRELLVVPIEGWSSDSGTYTTGAQVFRVTAASGIELRGVVSHGNESQYNPVSRSLYIGDVLYTVSYRFLKANALADLTEIATLEYDV